jgi:hypothetical protein
MAASSPNWVIVRRIEEMRQAYDLWAGTGAVVTTPFYLWR